MIDVAATQGVPHTLDFGCTTARCENPNASNRSGREGLSTRLVCPSPPRPDSGPVNLFWHPSGLRHHLSRGPVAGPAWDGECLCAHLAGLICLSRGICRIGSGGTPGGRSGSGGFGGPGRGSAGLGGTSGGRGGTGGIGSGTPARFDLLLCCNHLMPKP